MRSDFAVSRTHGASGIHEISGNDAAALQGRDMLSFNGEGGAGIEVKFGFIEVSSCGLNPYSLWLPR
jgi:hypothetical protein